MNNMTTLKGMDYYKHQKKKKYHQETKGIVQHVSHKRCQQGQSVLQQYDTQNMVSAQPAWDAWEEQVRRIGTSLQKGY